MYIIKEEEEDEEEEETLLEAQCRGVQPTKSRLLLKTVFFFVIQKGPEGGGGLIKYSKSRSVINEA